MNDFLTKFTDAEIKARNTPELLDERDLALLADYYDPRDLEKFRRARAAAHASRLDALTRGLDDVPRLTRAIDLSVGGLMKTKAAGDHTFRIDDRSTRADYARSGAPPARLDDSELARLADLYPDPKAAAGREDRLLDAIVSTIKDLRDELIGRDDAIAARLAALEAKREPTP